jgi:GNAT superfamily N-acetyltransferase
MGEQEKQMSEPRRFQNEGDLASMKTLVVKGAAARTSTYYVHPGDLDWWYSYTTPETNLRPNTYLWEAAGALAGFALISPAWHSIDLFVQPELRGSPAANGMLSWLMEQASQVLRRQGRASIQTLWIAGTDEWMTGQLESQGFARTAACMNVYERSLLDPLPEPFLPPGYLAGAVAGAAAAEQRAKAQYGAFDSSWDFMRYLERYLRFMKSPAYRGATDLMITSPSGECASFCIAWQDPMNLAGYFEPVGTAPGYQGRGLGRAVLHAGLRCLHATGMQTARVCAENENLAANKLYLSAGFTATTRLWTFIKEFA